jgi:hypothetical protein
MLYAAEAITGSPELQYYINFTTPGTYTVWLRGYAPDAGGDSAYLGLEPGGQIAGVTGLAPLQWAWASSQAAGPGDAGRRRTRPVHAPRLDARGPAW